MGSSIVKTNYQLGSDLYYQKKYIEAINYFNQCLTQNPADIESLYMRSLSFLNLKQEKEAQEDLDKIIKTDPKNYRAHYMVGCIYYYWLKYNESLAALKMCVQFKHYYHAYMKMGAIYLALNDPKAANGLYQKAVALQPSYDSSHFKFVTDTPS